MKVAEGAAPKSFDESIRVARFAQGSPFESLANSRLPIRVYKKGQWVCTEGDVLDCLYIVQEGAVLLSRVSAHGQETILGFTRPGDFFGDIPLLTGSVARFNALTLQPTVLLLVRHGEFKALLQDPDACRALAGILARRCEDAWTQIEALGCGSVEDRLRKMLSWLCIRMGVETVAGVRLNVTQSQLAQMVGTTRESLNRQVSVLKHQGILRVTNEARRASLLVLAPERLSPGYSHF